MNKPPFDPEVFVREMLKDEHAIAFFKNFDVESDHIKKFLTAYSKHKARVIEEGDGFTRHIHQMGEEHKKMAWNAYGAILNRKLFILQCRWRAEQVVLKDIAVSYDFWYWGRDPYICPFIDEVTAEELELMKGFLLQPAFSRRDLERVDNWQAYDEYVASPEESTNSWNEYPKWFDYCDAHGSDPDWRSLPDIRGQKERAYLYGDRDARTTPEAADTSEKETKKDLHYNDKELMAAELADLLGDMTTAQYIRDKYDARRGQLYPDVDIALMHFEAYHTEKFPVQANDNWGVGLNLATDQFFARRAAEVLEETHEEYIYRKANDLLKKDERNFFGRITAQYREIILEARKEKGEPADFNF